MTKLIEHGIVIELPTEAWVHHDHNGLVPQLATHPFSRRLEKEKILKQLWHIFLKQVAGQRNDNCLSKGSKRRCNWKQGNQHDCNGMINIPWNRFHDINIHVVKNIFANKISIMKFCSHLSSHKSCFVHKVQQSRWACFLLAMMCFDLSTLLKTIEMKQQQIRAQPCQVRVRACTCSSRWAETKIKTAKWRFTNGGWAHLLWIDFFAKGNFLFTGCGHIHMRCLDEGISFMTMHKQTFDRANTIQCFCDWVCLAADPTAAVRHSCKLILIISPCQNEQSKTKIMRASSKSKWAL